MITKGERYKIYDRADDSWHIYASQEKAPDIWLAKLEKEDDAKLTVSAQNACIKLNPSNPQAVADSIGGAFEALKHLPEPKSILADAAYTGGDLPKSWIRDKGNFNDGFNQALKDIEKLREVALAKAEGK